MMSIDKKWQIPKVHDTINEACTTSLNENVIFDIAVPSKQIVPIPKLLSINSHVLIQ
jgi:hypothetical protein